MIASISFYATDVGGIDLAAWANVIAAIIVAAAAWRGLYVWKQEHREKRNMALAEDVLAKAYECLDAIEWLRNGWMSAAELSKVPRKENETDEHYAMRRTYEVTFVRYQEHAEAFAALMSMRFRVEVFFSKDHRDTVEGVQRLANKITSAAQDAFRAASERERHQSWQYSQPERFQKMIDRQHAAEDILWGIIKETDTTSAQIAQLREHLDLLFRETAATGKLITAPKGKPRLELNAQAEQEPTS